MLFFPVFHFRTEKNGKTVWKILFYPHLKVNKSHKRSAFHITANSLQSSEYCRSQVDSSLPLAGIQIFHVMKRNECSNSTSPPLFPCYPSMKDRGKCPQERAASIGLDSPCELRLHSRVLIMWVHSTINEESTHPLHCNLRPSKSSIMNVLESLMLYAWTRM